MCLFSVLRRANEHETAAFYLVERSLRRTRPRLGPLGLKALEAPEGRIERGSLGRLRLRFDGKASDFEPENRMETRPLSEDEVDLWNGIQRIVSTTKPVADSDWNLLSMRIGPRILRRLPLGGVVTYVPNGTPPFKGSFSVVLPEPGVEIPKPTESQLLHAIDMFLEEDDHVWTLDASTLGEWAARSPRGRQAEHIFATSLGHSRRQHRGKWHKCPICHTPVVKGLFNPRIPYGTLEAGTGAIRDLRGGYMARLRETYLIAEPNSLVKSTGQKDEDRAGPLAPGPSMFH